MAAAAAPAPAAPRWVVDWGEQRCSLVRETGGPASLSLMVRTVPGAGQAELWMLDPKWKSPTFAKFEKVEVSLQPSGFSASQYALTVRFKGQGGVAVTNLDEGFVKNLAGAKGLRIERGRRRLADVPLPGSARAVEALRACEAAVLRDWGFDPEVIQSLSRTPRAVNGPAQWFSDRDYPYEAVRNRISGSVLTRLVIGADGRVAECIIVEGSGEILLDRTTCDLLVRRGRYEPALTATGQPVRAMSSVRIHWRLP
ncbi:MAG TPA: energy transducer TonB [Allosphingosinicella sp.]